MKEYPKGGLLGKAAALVRALIGMHISVYAAHAGYFIVLAVFPMLVLLVGMVRYAGLDVQSLIAMLEGVIPQALMPAAEKLIINTYRSTTGTLLSLSALTGLWSASRGIYGVLTGLNAIYGVHENRGYFYTRSVSVLYTFAFLLVLLLTLVLHVFGTTITQWIALQSEPVLQFLSEVVDLRFFLLLFIQTALFTAMFMALPNRKNKLTDSLPGALLSSSGWLIFSDLYSTYVEHFHSYTNIYGSVYAVALSMLWLYCCISIVFYGGALNRYLMDNKQV